MQRFPSLSENSGYSGIPAACDFLFSTDIIKGEMAHARFYPEEIRRQIPLCEYRKYTISEIINAVIESGFTLKRFDEHPAWTDPGLPGEFTVIAIKE